MDRTLRGEGGGKAKRENGKKRKGRMACTSFQFDLQKEKGLTTLSHKGRKKSWSTKGTSQGKKGIAGGELEVERDVAEFQVIGSRKRG